MTFIKKLRETFYGWWIVAASFMLFLVIGGTTFYGFTAFFNPIVAEMGWSRAQTSLAFSLRSIEGGIMRPIFGCLIARVGPRKCIFAGMLVIGAALILMSRIDSLYSFYGAFLLLALGSTAALGLAEYAAVANWFKRRRSLALGILSAGYGLSGVMTPVLVFLIHSYGWRSTMVIMGIVTLAIGPPLSLFIRHRPEQYGYLPDGDKPEDKVSLTPTGSEIELGRGIAVEKELSVQQSLRTRTFWLLMLFNLFLSFFLSAMSVHEMPYLISVGISEKLAALTMMGITTTSLIGRLGFSWLGDIYDKRHLLALTCVLQTVGMFIFANIRSPWMIIPFLLTYGPGYGARIPLSSAIQADYFGTKSFASLRGLYALGGTISGITAPLLAGWLYDVQGSYHLAFTIFAILSIFAIPTILAVRPVQDTIPQK